MTEDAEKLLEFMADELRSTEEENLNFETSQLKEIVDADRKIKRLLTELEEKAYVRQYHVDPSGEVYAVLTPEVKKYFIEKKRGGRRQEAKRFSLNKACGEIHELVMNKYIKKRFRQIEATKDIFEAYSNVFKAFVSVTDDELEEQEVGNLFEFVADKLDKTDDENFIKILGPDGTGKSTFLSILYVYLYDQYCNRDIREYPFYINLHYYDRLIIDAKDMENLNRKIEEKINEDIDLLIELSEKMPNTNFLIIIDGNEKYDRTHLKSSIILEKIVDEIKGHKKIICIGEKTNVHAYREREENAYIDKVTTYTFSFLPIYITEKEKWENVIKKYCKVAHKEREVRNIKDCINRFNIKEIDYNLLSILGECAEKCKLNTITSISDLYHKYCMNYLERSSRKLDISIELAYRYFLTTEFIEQNYISQNWREWELVHQHKSISNYLLALHYSRLILSGKEENVKELECVFTNGINIFLKSILNQTSENQRKTIKFCEIMFEKGEFRAKAQAAYLAGRIGDPMIQEDAKRMLRNQLAKWTIKNVKDEHKRRQQYFLKRSILVSLLYLGECDTGEILLNDFFNSTLMNEVNRAFYLQYYDDVRLEPEIINLKDDGQASITCTTGVLFNYINNQLQEDESDWSTVQSYEFQVYIFTLCSLVQIRVTQGQKVGIVDKVEHIISRTLECAKSSLCENMQIYLSMLLEDFQHEVFGINHLYDELYGVKDIQRRGWTEKIKKDSIQVERYENVIEHTYYAWLLGMLYLPEERPRGKLYDKYNKNKILNCLLIHDLAELYVNDKMPEEVTRNHREMENECMKRIFMHEMYLNIGSMDIYRKAWEDFSPTPNNINGDIAKEIDLIQAIYQFCVYKRNGAQFTEEKEREWRKEKDNIKTSIGKRILKEVVLNNFGDILKENME